MDILTSRKILRDHSLLKFNVALITDTPENICAENQISNHLLSKNRIKNVFIFKVELCWLVNWIIKNKAGSDNENSSRPCPGTTVRTTTLMKDLNLLKNQTKLLKLYIFPLKSIAPFRVLLVFFFHWCLGKSLDGINWCVVPLDKENTTIDFFFFLV